MKKNEKKSVEQYLKGIVNNEEKNIIHKYQSFYEKHKVVPKDKLFSYLNTDEYFFVILENNGYGIYYNDIEEIFGVCKLDKQAITRYAEFANGCLNGAVTRLNELLEDGIIDNVLR